MKWYEQKYVNHRDWILDNIELLNLTHTDLITVLVIDFLNEHHMTITSDVLCAKTRLSKKDLDIVLGDTRVTESPLFDLFETEFGRPLSQNEMKKISEWNHMYDKQMIIYALRTASAYQKMNLAYIDKILCNWRDKNVSLEMIEAGKYVD